VPICARRSSCGFPQRRQRRQIDDFGLVGPWRSSHRSQQADFGAEFGDLLLEFMPQLGDDAGDDLQDEFFPLEPLVRELRRFPVGQRSWRGALAGKSLLLFASFAFLDCWLISFHVRSDAPCGLQSDIAPCRHRRASATRATSAQVSRNYRVAAGKYSSHEVPVCPLPAPEPRCYAFPMPLPCVLALAQGAFRSNEQEVRSRFCVHT
jgi:hypothetical protein